MNAAIFQHREARRMSDRAANMAVTRRGIRIGIATVPRQRIEVTADTVRVQRAILSTPRSPDFWPGVALAGCGIGLVVMALAGWLPGGGI